MDWDDPEQPKQKLESRNLEDLSIEALGEYIDELTAEIERVREAIRVKEVVRDNAGSFFK